MESIDIFFTGFIQSLHTFADAVSPFFGQILDVLFLFFTFLSEETMLFLFILVIYWCFDKKFGEFLIISTVFALLSNGLLKDLIRRPRPFLNDNFSSFRFVDYDGFLVSTTSLSDSFSFPSGHSQCAAALYGGFAFYKRKRIYMIFSVCVMLLVGISRIYLGVHYPSDVIFGLIFGLLSTYLIYIIFNKYSNFIHLLFILMGILSVISIFIEPSSDTIKTAAVLTGSAIGMFLENKFVKFSTDGKFISKVPRLIFGVATAFLLKFGLKILFPETLLFDGIRYFIFGFVVIYICPLLFTAFEKRRMQ